MELIPLCKSCRKPKAPYQCGLCTEYVCKSCAQFLSEDAFSFLNKIPAELRHTTYCPQCFDEHVSLKVAEYEATLVKAREVYVFTKAQTKQTGHIKRKEDPYQVTDCEDEDETILRLAFFAAQEGFNCLLDLSITHRKLIVGSHKKTLYSGTAIPVTIDPSDIREY